MDHRNYLFVASSHPVTQIVLVEMSDCRRKCAVTDNPKGPAPTMVTSHNVDIGPRRRAQTDRLGTRPEYGIQSRSFFWQIRSNGS